MIKRKGVLVDLLIKLIFVLDGEEVYEWENFVIFLFK